MPGTSAIRPYKWLAQYYDQIFARLRSPLDEARRHVLKTISPNLASACDLACGTGSTALELAGKGIKVFGVDLSPVMCRLAREKARRAGLPVHVFCADMRRFRLPEPVDLITCEFDALNHIPRKTDLQLVAKAVARALRPGGYFYFDVNNRLAFERYWPGTLWVEKPGMVVVMLRGFDRWRERAWINVEWFIRDGNCWRRRHEHVEEICWTSSEIRRALRQAGFAHLRQWDATPFFKSDPLFRNNPHISPGCRTIYLARRSPD
jgi:SAM-dependent methyltransferase